MARANNKKRRRRSFLFKTFPRYEDVQCYLRLLEEMHGDIAKVETIGKSYEGRDIDMVVLRKFKSKRPKCTAFIDANIHAREWISISTALYFIDHIVRHPKYLNLMNYCIVPCLNPDGYEFTHTNQRLWRKNRNRNCQDKLEKQGVDLNRNFTCGFGLEGSSDDPTRYNYRGVCPLSEPESQALADTLLKYQREIRLYISIHSHGNLIIFPWGFTKTHVSDRRELEDCGRVCKRAIQDSSANGRKMTVGSVASKMELCAGTSMDFAKACHNIKFCYTIELQAFGKSGFTPDDCNIEEIGYETTEGILAMTKYVYKYYRGKEPKNML